MRRPVNVTSTVLMAALALPATAVGDWPTFRGDLARTGRAAAPIGAQPTLAWKTQLGGSVDGSPVVASGTVWVGTNHGTFAAVDAGTGAVRWRVSLDGAVCSAAALAQDRLVIGTARRFLYCLGLDGKTLWRVRAWDAVVASPLVLGDTCYWGSMDGVFHATRLADGAKIWEVQLAGGISAAAASDGQRIFVGDEAGTVWALLPTDGKTLWKVETSCHVMAAPVVADGKLLVPLVSPTRLVPPEIPYLMVLNADTGEQLWHVRGPRSIFASPILAPIGVAYVSVEGYLSDTLLRAQAADGTREVYRQQVGSVVDSSPAWAEDTAYFGAQDGCVYAVRLSDGAVLSRTRLAPKIYSSPALDGGKLYIGASDGHLYCLR
ncbi:MAG: PQQ-binding-like beta-propeller repeat protein [Armatimonadetes bacterium]|nr:PQQ-binding-like beta-propeller repeat protein [Armatimonadota bacterium]